MKLPPSMAPRLRRHETKMALSCTNFNRPKDWPISLSAENKISLFEQIYRKETVCRFRVPFSNKLKTRIRIITQCFHKYNHQNKLAIA